jgi:hypothetical protein
MADLLIRLTKRADGDVVLRCERADGTSTWQRQQGRNASFFVLHDLTHFAVETVLGCSRGFFGLVAEGWDIADTEGKSARGPLPPETIAVEHMVGFLDVERATGGEWSTVEWMEQGTRAGVDLRRIALREITDDDLNAIRSQRLKLLAQWASVPVGGELDLVFPDPGAAR